MKAIKLTFENESYIDTLQKDDLFTSDIHYLNPQRIDKKNLALFDPVPGHSYLDTELVVLSKFARAIKRIVFSDTNYDVVFLTNNSQTLKGGLRHDQERIISSTDTEIGFTVTIKEVFWLAVITPP